MGIVGPTEIGFDDAARLVASVLGKARPFVTMPIGFHYVVAHAAEATMTVPLISLAQVRILQEEVIEPANAPDKLPEDLAPTTAFDEPAVRAGLPDPGPFRLDDLRWSRRRPEGGCRPKLTGASTQRLHLWPVAYLRTPSR